MTRRLTPTHCLKQGKRHRYYVSNRLISGGPDRTGWRLPAQKLEQAVASIIADHIAKAATGHRLLDKPDLRAEPDTEKAALGLAQMLRTPDPDLLQRLLLWGGVSPQAMIIKLDHDALAEALHRPANALSPDLVKFSAPLKLRRRGVEAKLVLGDPEPEPDPVLLRALSDAHRWVTSLRDGTPLFQVARNAGHQDSFIRTRGQLSFLSPRIQGAIRDGTLPPELTLGRILRRPIPLDWQEQERLYGL